MPEALEAHGGTAGGAGTPTGEAVVVRLDGQVLDVFSETTTNRFHASLIDKAALEPSPAPTGEKLVINAQRWGVMIPVRFEGRQREILTQILASLG